MRKLTINLVAREKRSAVPPITAVVLLVFAVFLTWYNAGSFLDNSARLELLKHRAAELEKTLPDDARKKAAAEKIDRAALNAEIEFVNDYALRKSFSWTGLLTRLEEGLPDGVQLVSISPEFKSSKVNVTGAARSIDKALSTVDSLAKAGFVDVFLLKHARDEKSGLILFEISARYRASS